MSFPEGIIAWDIDHFRNAHENFTQQLDPGQSLDLHIQSSEWDGLSSIEKYKRCTANLQWVIQHALDNLMAIRAMGSGWSLSKVAVSDDIILNTKRLRLKFRLSEKSFDPNYLNQGNKIDNHRFLQCGNSIIAINNYLENQGNPPKSLRASGGSNGQTIVGAFSTNTHGAAFNYGALPEMILGLHIVTGPDRHVYIERETRRVTSQHFQDLLGAEVIIDDDLFNAALVSFGSFGIIHGVLVEVEDKFLLEQKLRRVSFDDGLTKAATLTDFNDIESHLKYPLDDADHPLYHFELAINPHDFAFNDEQKGAYLRIMHRAPYRDDYPKIDMPADGYTYGDDMMGLIQTVLDKVQARAGFLNRLLIPGLVNQLFKMAYDRPENGIGTIGETFRNTSYRGNLFSAGFGLRRIDIKKVIEEALQVNEQMPLAGVLAIRFVRGTQATLGFTQWPESCVLEVDGADAKINHDFVRILADRLRAADIPFTFHWGKINRIMDKELTEWMYGADTIRKWKQQRSRIMDRSVQKLFNNEFMERCGLNDFVPFDDIHPGDDVT